MKRRDFLKFGATATTATLVSGSVGLLSFSQRASASTVSVVLNAVAGDITMVDGTVVRVLTFSQNSAPSFPGPTILAQEGDSVQVTVNNTLNTSVVFALGGTGIRQYVSANSSVTTTFAVPRAGTYLYHDDQNNGVNRVLGLHGALVVMPAGYNNRSFAGAPTFTRQYKWLIGSVDTSWSNQIRANGASYVSSLNPNTYQPRYFTLNGQSYPHTNDDPNTAPHGLYGQAALIRLLNGGGMVNAPHFHGNHVEILSVNRQNYTSNRKKKDVVAIFPLDTRDVLLPFVPPPDAYPPITSQVQEFPMHCHSEVSQTAGGGQYPNGLHVCMHMGMTPPNEPTL